jgi:hypothetical protein
VLLDRRRRMTLGVILGHKAPGFRAAVSVTSWTGPIGLLFLFAMTRPCYPLSRCYCSQNYLTKRKSRPSAGSSFIGSLAALLRRRIVLLDRRRRMTLGVILGHKAPGGISA